VRGRPNILFVLTDDLDADALTYMPNVRRLSGRNGATFDDYLVSNSLCCPSRATTLRGQFAHNTGVWSNGGDNGGFEAALAHGLETDTVATRLRDAGYRTLLAGKYLNGYPNGTSDEYIPPGWSHWASAISGNPYAEYGYVLNHDGQRESHAHRPSDYGTDVFTGNTDRFIRESAGSDDPFFAYLAVYAPHQPATPAPADLTRFPTARAPRTASFDQADVTRSPPFVRDLPQFTTSETAAIDRLYRLRIRSLQAVDRSVARLVDTLRHTGQLTFALVMIVLKPRRSLHGDRGVGRYAWPMRDERKLLTALELDEMSPDERAAAVNDRVVSDLDELPAEFRDRVVATGRRLAVERAQTDE